MSTEQKSTTAKAKRTPKPKVVKVPKQLKLRVTYVRRISWGRYSTHVVEIESNTPFLNSNPRAILEKIVRLDAKINRVDLQRPVKAQIQISTVQDVSTATPKLYRCTIWDSASLSDWNDKGVYTAYIEAEGASELN